MFGYDSAEEFFAYQDQLDLEAAQRAQAQCAQYEEDLLHFEDNADIPF